jgi:hypothetical protein
MAPTPMSIMGQKTDDRALRIGLGEGRRGGRGGREGGAGGKSSCSAGSFSSVISSGSNGSSKSDMVNLLIARTVPTEQTLGPVKSQATTMPSEVSRAPF